MAVRNTHGCKFAGILKVFGVRAAITSSAVDSIPKPFRIRWLEMMALLCFVNSAVARRSARFSSSCQEWDTFETVFVTILISVSVFLQFDLLIKSCVSNHAN
jgi:hypothetical protein